MFKNFYKLFSYKTKKQSRIEPLTSLNNWGITMMLRILFFSCFPLEVLIIPNIFQIIIGIHVQHQDRTENMLGQSSALKSYTPGSCHLYDNLARQRYICQCKLYHFLTVCLLMF